MNTFLVDTHTHIYVPKFDEDRDAMIQRAIDSNVQHFFLPNIDRPSIPQMLELEAAYPERCHAMMGLHPCSVDGDYMKTLALMEKWFEKRSFCAVGEIGLDYYWDKTHIKEQKEAFRIQSRWAKELDIPIVIHARDSLDDLIQLVGEEKTDNFRGVFHCFGGSLEQAQKIIDLGFLMGIGGVLTFKKAGLDAVVKDIDLKHLVLETDSPYLTPHPYRGKRNESAYIKIIAERLAKVKGISLEEVAKATTANAFELFGIKTPAS
ncbi:MAG: TatD family hydrolase [Aureispira sp.]|nr:TatD family hydrolase [Aureispira sp.]